MASAHQPALATRISLPPQGMVAAIHLDDEAEASFAMQSFLNVVSAPTPRER